MMLERFPLRLEACKGCKSKPEKPPNVAEKVPRRSYGRKVLPKECQKTSPKSLKIELLGFLCSRSNFDIFFIEFGSNFTRNDPRKTVFVPRPPQK